MSDWQEYSLLEVFEVTNGLSKNRKEFGFGYPFLTFKEIFSNYFVPDELVSLANTTERERIKCSIKRGDVFITRTSEKFEELGITCVSLKDYPEATFNGFTKRLRPNNAIEIDPEYSSFYFKSPYFRRQMLSLTTMTTRASLNNEILERLTIILPPIEKQKGIAKVLVDCHNKIELNRQTNQTLEQIAQAIFKSWFVDFEPVKAKIAAKQAGATPEQIECAAMCAISGKSLEALEQSCPETLQQLKTTAALFPDALVESELGDIPVGWEVSMFSRLATNVRVSIKPREIKDNDVYVGLEHIDRVCLSLSRWGEGRDVNSNKSGFERGDVLFGKLRPYFHKVCLAASDGICSTDILVIRPKREIYSSLVVLQSYCKKFVEYANTGSTGTRMPRASWKDMSEYEWALPQIDLIMIFNELLEPMLNSFGIRMGENKCLSSIRDTLLPKLLSGEINLNSTPIKDKSANSTLEPLNA